MIQFTVKWLFVSIFVRRFPPTTITQIQWKVHPWDRSFDISCKLTNKAHHYTLLSYLICEWSRFLEQLFAFIIWSRLLHLFCSAKSSKWYNNFLELFYMSFEFIGYFMVNYMFQNMFLKTLEIKNLQHCLVSIINLASFLNQIVYYFVVSNFTFSSLKQYVWSILPSANWLIIFKAVL